MVASLTVEQKDYYKILQVSPGDPLDQIRASYKRLALLYHPDLSPHPRANQKMQLLNEAYSVLGNPDKRQRYDQERLQQTSPVQVQQQAGIVKPERPSAADQDKKLVAALRIQLKVLFWLLFLVMGLFGSSLLTGQINFLAVLLLIFTAVAVVFSMIVKIKKSTV